MEVIPSLYIGSYHDAISKDTFQIPTEWEVISIEAVDKSQRVFGVKYHNYSMLKPGCQFIDCSINQDYAIKLKYRLKTIARTIEKYERKERKVLVHCAAGINRSALVIGYYLIRKKQMNYIDAMDLLQAANYKRDVPVLTNVDYRYYLEHCRDEDSVNWCDWKVHLS